MSHQGTDPGGTRGVGPERWGLRSTARWAYPLPLLCAGVQGWGGPRGLGKTFWVETWHEMGWGLSIVL